MKTNPLGFNRFAYQNSTPAAAARRQATAQTEFSIPGQRGGDVVVLSRAAVAQGRPPAAQESQSAQAAAKDATPVQALTAAPSAAAAQATRGATATFGQSDLDAVRDHFGSRAGEEGFDAQADADGNGVVDFRDMTHVLSNWGQTRS